MNETAPAARAVHHVGMSVADLDAALGFWQRFLGVEARWRTVLDRPYLGRHVGYPGVRIEAAFLDLPGGIVLELLEYAVAGKTPNPEATANPGNVHLCLRVDDAGSVWKRAVAAGARPRSPRASSARRTGSASPTATLPTGSPGRGSTPPPAAATCRPR